MIVAVSLHAANVDDRETLRQMILQGAPWAPGTKLYADAGYVGKELQEFCEKYGIRLVAATKRKRNGEPSHTLSAFDKVQLKCRPRIEHINATLKNFRGIATKNVKDPQNYKSLVMLGVICISVVNYYRAKGKPKIHFNLRFKAV